MFRRRRKERDELAFWQRRHEIEGGLTGGHYEHFFTAHFGLDRSFYAGKRILDVGCGPRGSLEWASNAAERVGLDPLAERYRALGADLHAMRYVAAGAEAIPFGDQHFDVVSALNALDHVDDLDRAAAELVRVLAPGGTLLLIVEVNHAATSTEPQEFGFDVLDRFSPPLTVEDEQRYELVPEAGVLGSCFGPTPFDPGRGIARPGILSARLSAPLRSGSTSRSAAR
jgi:SAM-dependent methyltransferase